MAKKQLPGLWGINTAGTDYTTIENGKVVEPEKSKNNTNVLGFDLDDIRTNPIVAQYVATSDTEGGSIEAEDATAPSSVNVASPVEKKKAAKSENKNTKTTDAAGQPVKAKTEIDAERAAKSTNVAVAQPAKAKTEFDFKATSAKEAEKDAAERRVKEITIKSALSDEGIKKAKEHQQKIEAEKKKAQKQEQQAKVASLRASIPVNTQTKTAQENAASVQEWLRERQEKREKEEQEKQVFAQKTIRKYGVDTKTFSSDDFYGLLLDKAKDAGISSSKLFDTNMNYNFARFDENTARELEVLNQLAANNQRKETSNEDFGAFGTGFVSAVDSVGLGILDDLSDASDKRKYKNTGLPMEEYQSGTTGNLFNKSIKKHPVAYGAGQVAGSIPWWFAGGGGQTISGVTKARSAFNAAQATTKAAKLAHTAMETTKAVAPALTRLVGFSALRKATDAFDSDANNKELQGQYVESLKNASADNNAAGALAYATNTVEGLWDTPSQVVDVSRAYLKGLFTGNESTLDALSSNWNSLARKQAAYEGIMQDKTGAAKVAWSVGLNIGDNLIRNFIGGADGSMAIMAGTAFSTTVKQSYDETGDIYQSAANGIVQASLEYLTEHIPTTKFFEAIENPSTAKELVGNILKSMGIDGFGELVNALVGNAAEATILGDHSSFMQSVNEMVQAYTSSGMDEQEAKSKALKEAFLDYFVLQPLAAGAEGAISAGIMQGLANCIGKLRQGTADKNEQQATVDDMLSPFGKKDIAVDGADTKVAGTLPVGSVIAPDFTGAVAVEAEMKPRVRNVAEVIQKKTGVKIGFAEYYQNGQKNNAYKGHYDPTTKTMYFRKGASNAEIIYKTSMHELTHAIENTKHYAYVSNYVLNKKFGGVDSDKYKKAIAAKIAEYEKNGATFNEDEARSELIAGSLRETVFASDEDVRRIVEQDYTFAQHVHDWIDSMLYWVKNTFGDMDEKAQLQADLEQAQRKYRLALASAKGVRGGKSEYKIITLPDGRKYVQADRNAISEKDVSLISNEIERRINSEIRHGRNVSVIAEDGELLSITKDTAWKAGSRKIGEAKNGEPILMPEEKYRTKINAELHIDEIAKVSKRTSKTVPDKKDHDFAKDGFHYRTAYYRDYDGRYYKLGLSVGENNEVKTVYNIGSIRKETPIPHWGSKAVAQKRKDYGVSNNDYSNPTVKSQEGFYEETDFARALRLAQEKKNQFSFAPPKSDNASAGVEDFDVKANSEVSPELQKQLDDHVFNVQSDGSVRTLAQEKAARVEQAQSNSAPALDKQLTDNPDVAAIVQDSNVKRAEDITFAHTQKLQGKSSMLFKDLPRVLDYACGKVPGLREFWRNRIEVPFALAKASFTSRTRNVLTEYKSAVDKLGIRMGSKESAAAQYYGEGYRTEWVKNPEYKKGTDIPKYVEQRHTYTLADLKREFPNTWGNIVKLDEINRAMYDKYLVELNTMLEKVYPDVEVRIQNEILDHQRSVQYLRENPERVRMEIATLEQDISSIERNLEDFKRRRASGEDISATLDALEQRRASKQSELDALKNKGTKKAAHIQEQVAKASDKAVQLRAENAERLDTLIKRETKRLENKKAELAQKRNEISDAAQLRDAQLLSDHLSKIQELKIGLENGELLRGKRVLARSDYYHHFQDMATGFKGLANILFTSDEIEPRLVGVSENTQPKTKWAGFMQRQGYGPYKADAIGSMLDYMQAAEYKIAFDPIIADMRSVIKTIAEDTSETRNANGLILYLTRWTDGLAGKTSFFDRPMQEITQRKLTKALSWLNSRAKSNTILGSFRNFFAQFMNLPNGFLYVQDLRSWGSGVANAIATINKNSNAKSTISQSAFLGERYMDDLVGSFKESKFREIIKTPKKFALAMMSAGDKFSANIIWNAAYAQGKRNGLSDADLIMYADDITRRAVAGRGVGELPPGLESKWVNLLAPFQVEVNNTWNALVATYRGKEAKTIGQRLSGLIMFEAMSWGLNAATEALGIGSMLPSMIGMLWDAVKVWMDDDEDDSEDDANGTNEEEGVSTGKKVLKTSSLALNEMLSYMPFVSSLLPVLFDIETIEQFLGADNEITRYDSGNLGVSGLGSAVAKSVQGDWKGGLMDFASGYMMPWGGSQAKKLYEGFRDFDVLGSRGISASYTDDGNLRFPMERTPWNITKGMLLGKYATNEGMKYIDEGRKPMSDEQTGLFEYFAHHGEDPQKIYDYMNEVLSIDGERKSERQRQAIMDMVLTAEQKSIFDKGMLDERKNPVDYTSKESFFDTAYDKKRKSTYYLMDAGLSESKAESIINALSKIVGDKDETGNTIDHTKRNKRVKWIYNNKSLTDAQKAILYREYVINDGSTYKPYVLASALGFDDEMLAKYFPYFMVVEPDFYANGKAVPKSKNKNVRRLANELGLSQSQKDLVYYYFYSDTKEKDAAEAKLLNKLYKKLTPEQRKDFDAWYKDNDKRVDEKALLKVLEGLK